jgi:hypothetical protein
MAEESAKLRIPYLAAAQAQKHVTHNEAMTLLDTLVQLSVLDKDLSAPPSDPEEGDCYIVAGAEGGGTATGAWEGWETRVARYIDGTWRSYLPGQGAGAGWLAWVLDEDAMYRFDGEAWELAGIEGPEGPAGADPGILFAWDTGTTDADPGAGALRADNASLASATKLYISKTSRGGSSVATFLAGLDASTTASRKGILVLTRPSDERQAVFDVGAVTDATNYVKLAVANHAGATSFTAADPVSFQFWPTGDAGGAGGFNDMEGEWDEETTYDQFDVVSFAGSSYVSKDGGNIGNQPDASPSAWQLLAAKGEAGADGAGAVDDVNGQTGSVLIEAIVHGATGKSTPADADELGLVDSAAANVLKKLSWANLKATLKTYFDTLYQAVHANLTAFAGLTLVAERLPYANGSGTLALATFTAAGRALIDDADAAAQRATLGLDKDAIAFVIDGGGAVLTTGIKGDLLIPFACTIAKATLLANQSGSIVIDVWKDSYANFPPTDADSITASAPPTISSATKAQDATLTGWTKTIAAGDILRFNVDSVTAIQRVTVVLEVTK